MRNATPVVCSSAAALLSNFLNIRRERKTGDDIVGKPPMSTHRSLTEPPPSYSLRRHASLHQYHPDNPLNPANKYNPDVPFAPLDGGTIGRSKK